MGVVHLPPLPGAPGASHDLEPALDRALLDADALVRGGVDGLILENLGDAPFAKDSVPPVTVAVMTRVAAAVIARARGLPVGVNVLRNDGLAALAVAAATGASFVRINVLSGAMVTDQGIIEGRAREIAFARAAWAPGLRVAADVRVKHAVPLGPAQLDDLARDTYHRAGANALIVSGTGTGRPTARVDLETVRAAVPEAPLWLGSGATPATASDLAGLVDTAIVGSWLHHDGDLRAPVDARRVAEMAAALRG